jgi:hypothetical protein
MEKKKEMKDFHQKFHHVGKNSHEIVQRQFKKNKIMKNDLEKVTKIIINLLIN